MLIELLNRSLVDFASMLNSISVYKRIQPPPATPHTHTNTLLFFPPGGFKRSTSFILHLNTNIARSQHERASRVLYTQSTGGKKNKGEYEDTPQQQSRHFYSIHLISTMCLPVPHLGLVKTVSQLWGNITVSCDMTSIKANTVYC